MLTLVVVAIVLYAMLALLITAWSMWFQTRVYTEASEGLAWRGPAAAGVILVPILLWLFAARGSPDTYRPVWEFTSRRTSAPFKKILVPDEEGKERPYTLEAGQGGRYILNGRPLEGRPRWVAVEEDGTKSTFKPERDEKGNFKTGRSSGLAATTTEPLRYVDESGRVMLEGSLGRVTVYRSGAFAWNILLHVLLLGACFAGLWVIVRFQWLHALGQAVVLWALLLLFVIPPAVAQVEAAAAAKG